MQSCSEYETEEKQLADDLSVISQDQAAHRITRTYAYEMLRRLAASGSYFAGRAIARLSGEAQRRRNIKGQAFEPISRTEPVRPVGPFSGRGPHPKPKPKAKPTTSGLTIGDAMRAKSTEEMTCSN